MSRRRIQSVAVLLTAVALAETVLAVLALGHRHSTVAHQVNVTHVGGPCSHHHRHENPLRVSDATAPDDSNDSHGSSESDCSICRYLAQPALAVTWTMDLVGQDLVDVVFQVTSFDVETPAHLFPQPRSPPVAV